MAKVSDEEIVLNFRQTGADETIKKVEQLTKTIIKFNSQYNKNKSQRAKELPTDATSIEASVIRSFNRQSSAMSTKKALTRYRTVLSKQTASLFSEPYQTARAESKGLTMDQQFADQETKLKWQEEHIAEIADQERRRVAYNEQLAKLSGKQQTALSKLGKTFQRIGFYRIARLTFSTIEKGLSQGINDYASFDKGMSNTMSQLTSSMRLITSSIGMLTGSLLQIVAPLIQTIGTSLAKISNGIAAITAKQKNQNEYTRINIEYWQEYNKEVNKSLLSFDKFETLSGGQDQGPFETAKIDEANNDIQGIGQALSDLTPILTVISSIAVVKWVLNDGPTKLLTTMKSIGLAFKSFDITKLSTLSTVLLSVSGIILGIQSAVTGIIDLVTNWKDMSWAERIVKILKVIMGAVAALLGVIAIFTKNIKLGIASASLGIAAAAIPTKFAEGGIPDKGSLFYAGEAGAELVHTMPSGNTGVTNIAQFKQAMIEALKETGYSANQNMVAQLNVNGREFATAVFNDFDYTGKRLTGAGWGGTK